MTPRARAAVRRPRIDYGTIFEHMLEGMAVCRLIRDREGRPCDWLHLDVNPAFERATGLRDMTGKHVSEVLPDLMETNPEVFAAFGRVVTTGVPETFQTYVPMLDRAYAITAIRPAPEHFVVLFEDVTERSRTEAALRESERRYRAVVEGLAEGVVIQDATGAIVASNHAAQNILGLEVDEITGRTAAHPDWHPIWPDGTRPRPEDHPSAIARTTGQPVRDVVMGVRHTSGATRWTHLNAMPLGRDDGSVEGAVVSFTDVTERLHQDRALRDSEALLRQAQATARVGGWSWDAGTNVVTWTDEVYRIHEVGLDHDPSSAVADIGFYAPGDRELIAGAFRNATEQGVPYDLQVRLTTASGAQRWVRTVGVPEVQDGHVVRVYGTIQDLTDLHQAQEELRAANQRLRRFVESDIVGVVIARPTGEIVEANDYYLDLIGYSRDELVAGAVDWRALTPPEWLPADERALVELRERGVCTPYEKEYLLRDGRRVAVFLADALLPGPEEEIAAFVLDISDRKRAEREAQALNAELEERVRLRTSALEAANRELEAFSYSVSHDLRAPLRAIDGFTRIFLEEHGAALDAEGKHLLHAVLRNSTQMSQLIDDLLAYSRVGRKELGRRRVDMAALARSVADEVTGAEVDRDLRIEVGPLCSVTGDATLLRQVWQNLLANAAKFTRPVAEARIEVTCHQDAGGCRYAVRDNGVGYDPTFADKLFEPFQRLHRAEDFEGTGIGLAIVARIVQRHGGTVTSDGAVGRGATFEFSIPPEVSA